MSKSIDHFPINDNGNGWSLMLPPRTPKSALNGEQEADWLVIGAGYAGLGAARRFAENRPNDRVIVLEAHEIGENASGRNSGFAIDIPHVIGGGKDEMEGSHRYMALSRAAIDYHETQIDKYRFDCDWSQPGKYQTASSERGVGELLEPFAKEMEVLGEPFEWVDKAECDKRLGTTHFKAAVYTPGCRLLNPAALCRGLADNMPDNVMLYENSPVINVDYANGIRVQTPNGEVRAAKLFIGVNGFAEKFGYYQRRLLPCAANASLSRQLTEAERKEMGSVENWGVTPSNAFVSVTMRYTNDHRILMRNNIYYNPAMRESNDFLHRMRAQHQRLFEERFPMLPEVSMEYTWTGFVCLSQNGAPGFGELADNVYASVCQNAIGVTKGTIGGMLAADMACGEDNELIGFMQSLGEPSKMPPRPFLDIGVRSRMNWELWRNRHEA